MKFAIPKAIENRPWIALAIIIVVSFASAFNVTIAEYRDQIDDLLTTKWQPELVLDAWSSGLRTFALAIYAYMTRSGTADRELPDSQAVNPPPKPEP